MTDAETAARQAIELDPHSASAYFNLGLLLAQDPARASEAEAAYGRACELEPSNARYIYRLGLFLHENLHRSEEAEPAFRRALALAPNDAFYYGGLISLLVQKSRRVEAETLGAEMRALLGAGGHWYGLAALEAVLGDIDTALAYLRQAAAEENFNREWAWNDPDLIALRDDARFLEVVGNLV